ncbi:YtxH domain-containing protein [Lysinibacillus sp. 3P01SB]|uniref:YtxH domain-containing protein n=1 Tax=Lysinibacillus sp. 3P01SB TaxID=3132284 RepID=UPI0039A71578
MAKSKLIPAVLLGALTGAVISMLDKNTRQHTIETSKKIKETVTYYAQNSDELVQLIETKVEQAQNLYSSAQKNIDSIMSQVEDAKALPDTVMSMVTETKEAFTKPNTEA